MTNPEPCSVGAWAPTEAGRVPGSFADEPRRAYTDGLDQHHDFGAFHIQYDVYWMAYYAPLAFALMMRGGGDEQRGS